MTPNQEQLAVLRYALETLVETLRSPESADRSADPAQAERHIQVAGSLLAQLPGGPSQPSNWERDDIQFPRLIAEINATQDSLNLEALAESMDLSLDEVVELFDRADQAWEAAKAATWSAANPARPRG